MEEGNWRQGTGRRELEEGNWRQGAGGRELEAGNWGKELEKELEAGRRGNWRNGAGEGDWRQGTGGRELEEGNWKAGSWRKAGRDLEKELEAGSWWKGTGGRELGKLLTEMGVAGGGLGSRQGTGRRRRWSWPKRSGGQTGNWTMSSGKGT